MELIDLFSRKAWPGRNIRQHVWVLFLRATCLVPQLTSVLGSSVCVLSNYHFCFHKSKCPCKQLRAGIIYERVSSVIILTSTYFFFFPQTCRSTAWCVTELKEGKCVMMLLPCIQEYRRISILVRLLRPYQSGLLCRLKDAKPRLTRVFDIE